jgi:hypothetical protein
MTNSIITFSNNWILELLYSYLDGKLSLGDLLDSLSKHIVVEFSSISGRREILRNNLEGTISLEFRRIHLSKMLTKYLEGQISELDLSDWCAFIFLSGLFVPEGKTEEERWEAGNGPVWDILQQLMSPSVFGGLDFSKAKDYLDYLEGKE